AFAILVTLLIFWLLKAGVKLIRSAVGEEKTTPAILIALGAIGFLFPKLIAAMWEILVAIINVAFVQLPALIQGLSENISCDGKTLTYCVQLAFQAISKTSGDYANVLLSQIKLEKFPVADLLVATGLLALTTLLIRTWLAPEQHGTSRFSDSTRRLWNTLRT